MIVKFLEKKTRELKKVEQTISELECKRPLALDVAFIDKHLRDNYKQERAIKKEIVEMLGGHFSY